MRFFKALFFMLESLGKYIKTKIMESFWDKLLSGSEAILEPLHVPLFTAGGSQIDTFDILEFCLVFLIAYWLGKLGEEKHQEVRLPSQLRPSGIPFNVCPLHPLGHIGRRHSDGLIDDRSPDHTLGDLSFCLISRHRLRTTDDCQ